jgi:hypothetical protein
MNPQEMFHTSNLKVATALVTLGFELCAPPVTRQVRDDGRETTIFWFQPTNPDGKSAMDVFRGMTKDGEKLAADDPENPINYLRCALANRDELVSLVKNSPRHVVVSRNGKKIAIREDASEETREKFSRYL